MRDQYAGDVSDFIKFGLLRALARNDRRLGVGWYYDPGHDGGTDGRHLEWRECDHWRAVDAVLHDQLSAIGERTVAALEAAPFWPSSAVFHRTPMPQIGTRYAWAAQKRQALSTADLVFLDPDNGIGPETRKHATFAELRACRRPDRSIVFITFPARRKHDELVAELHERVASETGTTSIVTLRTNASVPGRREGMFVQRPRWFTLIDADDTLITRAAQYAERLAQVPRVRARLT